MESTDTHAPVDIGENKRLDGNAKNRNGLEQGYLSKVLQRVMDACMTGLLYVRSCAVEQVIFLSTAPLRASAMVAKVIFRNQRDENPYDREWIDMKHNQADLQKAEQRAKEMSSEHVKKKRHTVRRQPEIPKPKVYGSDPVSEKGIMGQSKSTAAPASIPSVRTFQKAIPGVKDNDSTFFLKPEFSLQKQSEKKRDKQGADELQCIFPRESWYEKSKLLNKSKGNFLCDILRSREVMLNDTFWPSRDEEFDQKKGKPIYSGRSPDEPDELDELRDLLRDNPNEYKRCTMSILSSQKAHCRLVNPEDHLETIEINGRTRCGQAFNNDEVVTKVLNDETRNGATNGEVVGVLKRHANTKHPLFLCEADTNCPGSLMKPQCKTVPKLKVLKPRLITGPSPRDTATFDIAIFNIKNGNLNFSHWVSLLRSESDKYLYWVVYLKWQKNYLFPLGVVVKIMDMRSCSRQKRKDMLLSGETIKHQLKVLYDSKTLKSTHQLFERTCSDICYDVELMRGRKNLTKKLSVFTVDPPGSKDLDDALSVDVNPDGSLSVGVHIADVSAFVKVDDEIDKEAFQRGTSHYPLDKAPIHMLPEPLSTNRLSLKEGQNRLTLSLFFSFTADGKLVEESERNITKTAVRSRKQFTYKNVQDIIEARERHTDVSTLAGKIVRLHGISMKLRRERLGDGCYHCPLDWLDGDLSTWEAHSLVEELMLLANKEVAKFLMKRVPECTPLRCQKPPTDEEIEAFKDHVSSEFIDEMFYLQQFPCFDNKNKTETGDKNAAMTIGCPQVPVEKWVWQLLFDAMSSKDPNRVGDIVQLECLHPSHALAMYGWTVMQKAAEYECSNGDSSSKHFSLGNILYTQFTSPLRRYLDIVVHRLVHSVLDETGPRYESSTIREICECVNRTQIVAKSYGKCCQSVKLALKLEKQPMNVMGIVVSVTDQTVELLNPFLLQSRDKVSDLKFCELGVCSQPMFDNPDDTSEGATLKWKKRSYDARGTHPHAKPSLSRTGQGRKVFGPLSVFPRLDPMNNVSQISLADWDKLRCVVTNSKKKRNIPMNIYPRPPTDYTIPDVTSEVRDGELVEQHCKFSLSMKRGQCVSVQLSASQTNGLLQPEIQLCTVAPSVTLCLLHMRDPINMFTKHARCASKTGYSSVEEYQKIWKPIIAMETAANIIKDPEEAIVINNLGVTLVKTSEQNVDVIKYSGQFTLGKKFCEDRCIFLDVCKEDEDSFIKGYMYVCIRHTRSGASSNESSNQQPLSQLIQEQLNGQTTWIAHGQVRNVEISGQCEYLLSFELNHISQRPPEELFCEAGVSCTVELLQKGPGETRIEQAVSDLKEDTLAAHIAKDYKPTPSDEMKKQRQIISKMKTWMQQKVEELGQSGLDLCMWEVKSRGSGLPGNNKNQHEAIEKALQSKFSIIHGPPGTGKTFTAIKLVYFFVLINKFTQTMEAKGKGRLRQVLFCGPSNKSVDVVAKYLKKNFGRKCPKIIRVYGETIESKEFPVPTKWISPKKQAAQGVCDPELKDVALHHVIRRPDSPYSADILKYDKLMKTMSPNKAQKKRKDFLKLLFKAGVEELKECEVVLCTTTCSSSNRVVEGTNIFQCIVDECGMCPEPECLVPLVSSQAEQVVLIGDHKQLQPIIMSKDAARLGLQKSLFERYAGALENQPSGTAAAANYTMLNIQYRMHPSICDFPSKTFYNDKLVTGPSFSCEVSRLPIWPGRQGKYKITDGGTVECRAQVVFCHIEGKEESLQVSTSEGNENSKSNKDECDHVVKIVNALIGWHVDTKHINVMSQYSAQCSELRQRLKHVRGLNVNTVVTSQGGEWDYVVFSLVRSLPQYLIDPHPTIGWCQQNLGFITDEHQVNVALTRAKKGLILIGNKNLLQCHAVWKKLFEYYAQLGCLVEAKNFPPSAAFAKQASHPA